MAAPEENRGELKQPGEKQISFAALATPEKQGNIENNSAAAFVQEDR